MRVKLPVRSMRTGRIVGKVRDSQRSKVYEAERAAFRSLGFFTEAYPSLSLCHEKISKWMDEAWFKRRFGEGHALTLRGGRGKARGGLREIVRGEVIKVVSIKLPPWARNSFVMLHELAHACTMLRHETALRHENVAAHGPEYCKIYLELVAHYLGQEYAEKLECQFRVHNVRYRTRKQVKRKPLTAEQKAALVERLSAARAAKAVKRAQASLPKITVEGGGKVATLHLVNLTKAAEAAGLILERKYGQYELTDNEGGVAAVFTTLADVDQSIASFVAGRGL